MERDTGSLWSNGTFVLDGDEMERRVARETVRAALFGQRVPSPALGRYELRRRLGSGGMGVVFLAHDPRLDRKVAIKVLRDDLADAAARDRLLDEARSIARLQHPNVVAVYDADVHEGRMFVAMEYVDGAALQDWMREPRSAREVVDVLLQAGRGLAAAHAARLVHRDFKPGNVLVGRDGRARVVDFGLAREHRAVTPAAANPEVEPLVSLGHTRSGLAGTPAYMAPEHLVSGVATARSDQYAFCLTLYEALFGHHPYPIRTIPGLVEAMLSWTPELPREAAGLPAPFRRALLRGLSRRPQDRFSELDPLLQILQDTLPALPSEEEPPAPRTCGQELPSWAAWLAALPRGLDGFPGCTVSARSVRLALARRPLGDDLPREIREACEHPSLRGERVATPRARLILLALYERHFGDPDAWRTFQRGLIRSALSENMQAMALPGAGPTGALPLAARLWNDNMQGIRLELAADRPRHARVELSHPEGLYDPLMPLDLEEHLRTCLELAGARLVELSCSRAGPDRLGGTVSWA